MNRFAGTMYCVKCGKPAILHCGYVKAKEKMALGNLIDIKIIAGWCSEDCHDSMGGRNCCFGTYNHETMGYMYDVFNNPNVKDNKIK